MSADTDTARPEMQAKIEALADAALELAAGGLWEEVGLAALCQQAGLAIADVALAGISRERVREALERRLDRAMLAVVPEAGARAKDRLFDVLMGRFDAMEERREAWTSILIAEGRDGSTLPMRTVRLARTTGWALDAAGIVTGGAAATVRKAGLTRILLAAQEAWLADGPDLARTMRALDQGLQQSRDTVAQLRGLWSFLSGQGSLAGARGAGSGAGTGAGAAQANDAAGGSTG